MEPWCRERRWWSGHPTGKISPVQQWRRAVPAPSSELSPPHLCITKYDCLHSFASQSMTVTTALHHKVWLSTLVHACHLAHREKVQWHSKSEEPFTVVQIRTGKDTHVWKERTWHVEECTWFQISECPWFQVSECAWFLLSGLRMNSVLLETSVWKCVKHSFEIEMIMNAH